MAGTQRLKVYAVQGENGAQAVVRGKIEVPHAKPDVDKILSKDATANVRKVSIVPNKVIVEGTLNLQVMYIAFKPDQSVHSMHGDVRFTTFVDVPGAEPDMDYYVDITVEDVSLTPSRTDARKFDVAAVLSVFAKITEVDEMEVLTEVPEGNEALETEDITVEHLVGEKATKQIIVSEEFDVPKEKPDPKKILDTKAEVVITDKRLVANKVIIDGEVRLQVLYVALKPEQSVHDLHHTIRFNDFVEVPNAMPGMNVQVRAVVESAEVNPVIDPALVADVILKLTAFVTETRTLFDVPTQLEDETAYSRRLLKVDREIGTGESQVVLRETTEIPPPKPDIIKVLDAWVDKIDVTDKRILDGKVLIRGTAHVEIVYVSDKPSQAVHALHKALNFRTIVEIPGAMPDMEVKVKVDAEYVNVEQVGIDVHIEAVLRVRATVTEMAQTTVYVPEFEPTEEPEPTATPCPPTPYTVRPGDTLSKIAARTGTTVQMILELNPQITDPDVIEVGQVIMIPCPAMG
jgi:LysM repeat protein